MPHLITPGELHSARESDRPVRLLDVRWRLDAPEGRPGYIEGHLPEAVYVDLENELARPGYPEEGRYPLPASGDLERSLRRWGVDDGDLVVAYDDNHSVAAARAWWLLRRRGVDIRVLDGGIRAWARSGYVLERGDHAPAPGSATLSEADLGIATIDDAARAHVDGYLVDVRTAEHYRGLAETLDPVAGHIPGAVNIPVVTNIARDGALTSPDQIRATLATRGVDPRLPITLYCGAGISSAHTALALTQIGVEATIFTGSWSQWARSNRSVAVGPTPSELLTHA